MASASARQKRVVLILLLLALAGVAGVWGRQAEQREQEAAVDAKGMPEVAAGSGHGGGGLFGRMARMLDTGSAEDDDGVPIDWEATKDEGTPVDPSRPFGSMGDLADAWSIDKAMQMVRRTLDGDPSGAFKDMIANAKDLQDAWANPTVFKYLFNEFPLFQAIKPVAAIGNKQTITAQDVRGSLTSAGWVGGGRQPTEPWPRHFPHYDDTIDQALDTLTIKCAPAALSISYHTTGPERHAAVRPLRDKVDGDAGPAARPEQAGGQDGRLL